MILTSCQVVICCCGEAMVSRDGARVKAALKVRDHDGLPKVGLGHKKSASTDAARKKVSAEASWPEKSPEPQKRSREARNSSSSSRSPKGRNSSSSLRSPEARNSSSSLRSREARDSSSSFRSREARNSSSSLRSREARNSSSSSRSREARNSSSSLRSREARNSSSSSRSREARNSSSSSRKAKQKPFLNSEHQRISCFWCFLILETSRYLSQHVLQLYFVPSLVLAVFHVLHLYKQTSSQLWPSFNFICRCLSFELSVNTILLVTKGSARFSSFWPGVHPMQCTVHSHTHCYFFCRSNVTFIGHATSLDS